MTSSHATQLIRSDGVTQAERFLKRLCERSFLSLWSHVGIYRDQGHVKKGGDGKEVCDLLVVFQNHVLIFSDKDCEFPNTGNIELDWSRWYRKAVQKSAEQVWGAERWILSNPNRLFLDRACTIPFPFSLPDPSDAKVHRIVVAHAASRRCAKELGGTGSLMIAPSIISEKHCAPKKDGGAPFTIGQINPSKGYVHVFDDTTLIAVMETLDTITDFVEYLTRKEQFITSGKLIWAAGEDDLLAYYLKYLNANGEHDFIVPSDITGITINEGLWETFINTPERRAQLKANEVSYSWDALIETFLHHVYAGTSHYISHPQLNDQERLFRLLVREPRTRRRMLGRALLDFIARTPKSMRATRTIFPSRPGDPYYVFFLLPHLEGVPYEEYREVRRNLLADYCVATKVKCPDAQDFIGIATESGRKARGSEDIIYYDASSLTPEEQAEAQRLHAEMTDLGLFGEPKWHHTTEKEYPDLPEFTQHKQHSRIPAMKGRNRNDSCPCGSGKKFKKCCG
jgi:hypothetical protein